MCPAPVKKDGPGQPQPAKENIEVRELRENRERLVMKPNDEYGGKGVFIGWEMSPSEWDRALADALSASYVVQEKVELLRQSFPELAPELRFRDLVVDLDPFVFNGEVEGFLTRLSGTSLANVTSGGGQVPVLAAEMDAFVRAVRDRPPPPVSGWDGLRALEGTFLGGCILSGRIAAAAIDGKISLR